MPIIVILTSVPSGIFSVFPVILPFLSTTIVFVPLGILSFLSLSSSVAAITPPMTPAPTNHGKSPISLLPASGNKTSKPEIPLKPEVPSNQ